MAPRAMAVMVDVSGSAAAPHTAVLTATKTRWRRLASVGVGGLSGAAVGLTISIAAGVERETSAFLAAGGGVLAAVLVWVR